MFRCKFCGAINRVPDSRSKNGSLAVCGRCKTQLDLSGAPQDVSASGLAQALGTSPVPVLVDFWAPGCQLSRAAGEIVDQVAREHAGTVITLMLNTEQEPAPAVVHGVGGILTAEGLAGISTFIVFRAGREVARRSGLLPRRQFSRWLDSAQQGASVASSPM